MHSASTHISTVKMDTVKVVAGTGVFLLGSCLKGYTDTVSLLRGNLSTIVTMLGKRVKGHRDTS